MGLFCFILRYRMFAETSEKKMTRVRIGFALLCGLAVCCSVMYITADASEEYIHEVIKGHDAGSSVGSTDVLKAGQIYSETPDGRMRLMDYFNNVEKEISDEVANRKSDIASVRAQMARDFAFNAAARARLKRDMLHKMAVNARIARRNLDRAMRRTQMRFAHYAHLNNRRNAANLRRDKRTLHYVAKDKRESQRHLHLAVSAWKKATNAWSASTNARIDRMNAHVAANAAQIKENAKKARKDLDNAMHQWTTRCPTSAPPRRTPTISFLLSSLRSPRPPVPGPTTRSRVLLPRPPPSSTMLRPRWLRTVTRSTWPSVRPPCVSRLPSTPR